MACTALHVPRPTLHVRRACAYDSPRACVSPTPLKRLLVGRPIRSERLGETLLPKRIALPVFASDALSSVAYAPDEIFLTLALAGVAAPVVLALGRARASSSSC